METLSLENIRHHIRVSSSILYIYAKKTKQTHQYKIQQLNSLLNLTCGVAASIVLKASVSRRGNLFGVAEAVGKGKCCVIEDDCLLQKRIFFLRKKKTSSHISSSRGSNPLLEPTAPTVLKNNELCSF